MPKALGSEIKKFWFNCHLSDEWEHNDDNVIDEFEDLKDTEKYELNDLGSFTNSETEKTLSFTKAFKDWQKQQTHTQLLIEVPKEQELNIKVYLQTKNVKILN